MKGTKEHTEIVCSMLCQDYKGLFNLGILVYDWYIEEFHCLFHKLFSQIYFYQELLHMQMTLQENMTVGLGGTDQPSTVYLVFGKYLYILKKPRTI